MKLLLLAALAFGQDEEEAFEQQLIAAQPFVVKAPKYWRASPESLERLLLRGEALKEEVAPYIVVERLKEDAREYIRRVTAPKTRTEPRVIVEEVKHKLGPAWRFKKSSKERYPKGAPDARLVDLAEEHVVLQAGKRAYLIALISSQADYKAARRDLDKVIESFRLNDKIVAE